MSTQILANPVKEYQTSDMLTMKLDMPHGSLSCLSLDWFGQVWVDKFQVRISSDRRFQVRFYCSLVQYVCHDKDKQNITPFVPNYLPS